MSLLGLLEEDNFFLLQTDLNVFFLKKILLTETPPAVMSITVVGVLGNEELINGIVLDFCVVFQSLVLLKRRQSL